MLVNEHPFNSESFYTEQKKIGINPSLEMFSVTHNEKVLSQKMLLLEARRQSRLHKETFEEAIY